VKKLALLLLAVSALALLSCPSDVEPAEQITDYDFIINGSDYKVEIPTAGPDGFVITQGEEYRVAFRVEAADADFYGSRVGGKLIYKDENDDTKVLAGWTWLNPPFISGPGTYRWKFKAGDVGTDGEGDPIVSPATTPSGMKQYFTLNAQTPSYTQYPDYYTFKIKGSITVVHYTEPVGTLTSSGVIALDFSGASHDSNIGKGNIEGAEFDKVKAASGNGAFLRFTIENVTVDADANKDGKGIGAVGNLSPISGSTDDRNYQFMIVRNTPVQTGYSFTVDVPVEELLSDFVGATESHIFVNMWGDGPAKCSKVELFEYK